MKNSPFSLISLIAAICFGFRFHVVEPGSGGGEKKPFNFEDPNVGEQFGGSYPQLDLQENAVSEELTFVKMTKITVDDDKSDQPGAKKDLQIPLFQEVASGLLFTGPIGAIFQKCWDEAKIKRGDVFRYKRYPNVEKKAGVGKGNKMEVYSIKVLSRA